VHGGCGAGEVIDLVDLDVKREGHVMAEDFEPRVSEKLLDVAAAAGEEVVNADDLMTLIE
jgi:hypothetical protein